MSRNHKTEGRTVTFAAHELPILHAVLKGWVADLDSRAHLSAVEQIIVDVVNSAIEKLTPGSPVPKRVRSRTGKNEKVALSVLGRPGNLFDSYHSMTEIVDAGVLPQSVCSTVKILEEKGLAERHPTDHQLVRLKQ